MGISTILFVALATVTAVYGQIPIVGCRKVFDVVLVIDGNVSEQNFRKIKSTLTDLVNRLDIKRDQIWFGLVVYSSTITDVIQLENDKNKILQRIAQLKHAQTGTNTALAVQTMNAFLQKSGRKGVPKMGVVITDGLSSDPAATYNAAMEAIAYGVRMFSVGVGSLVHSGELGGLASGPRYTMSFKSFDEMSLDFIEDIASHMCPAIETKSKCPGPLDLTIVVDGSDSISDDNFMAIKTAIIGLLDELILGEDNVKFGLVLYSSNITHVLGLSSNKEHIRTQVAALMHARQGTNTHLGIREMTMMFAQQGRKGVQKAGIVITDGISKDTKKTIAAAAKAKSKNIKMFSVGITKHIDMDELKSIASSADNVILLTNFGELKTVMASLIKRICPVITTTTTTTTSTTTMETTTTTTPAETTTTIPTKPAAFYPPAIPLKPATGSKAPATGSKAPPTGSKAPASGSKAPATGSKASATGSKAPATGSKAPATGSKAVIVTDEPISAPTKSTTTESKASIMADKQTKGTQTPKTDCVKQGKKVKHPKEDSEREEIGQGAGRYDNYVDKVARLLNHKAASLGDDDYMNNHLKKRMPARLLKLLFDRRRRYSTGYKQHRMEDDDDYRQNRRAYGKYGNYRREYDDDDYRQGHSGFPNFYFGYDDK